MVCCGETCTGFRDFLLRGNVIDIAVGIVIGGAFKSLIDALVADLITPLIGVAGNLPDFSAAAFSVRGSTFKYGDFINAMISFFILSLVIYFAVVVPANYMVSHLTKTPEAETTCEHCLQPVPPEAKVCHHCTRDLTQPKNAALDVRGRPHSPDKHISSQRTRGRILFPKILLLRDQLMPCENHTSLESSCRQSIIGDAQTPK